MSIQEEAGKVAISAVDAFRAQPGLLFLTIINIAFLAFVYFMGTLVLKGYLDEQAAVRERYSIALRTLDRCIAAGLSNISDNDDDSDIFNAPDVFEPGPADRGPR